MFGGISLIRSLAPLDVIALPVPAAMRIVMAHPDQRLRTADARAALPQSIDRALVIAQMANVAAMVSGFWTGDLQMIGRGLEDQIAEPARAPLLPGFIAAITRTAGPRPFATLRGSGPVSGPVAGRA